MDPDLQQKLNETAVMLLDWAQQGTEFIRSQAPLAAQEQVQWYFVDSLLDVIPWALFMIGLWIVSWLFVLFARHLRATENQLRESSQRINANEYGIYVNWARIAAAVALLSSLAPLSNAFDAASAAYRAKVAPRTVIIDWVRSGMQK